MFKSDGDAADMNYHLLPKKKMKNAFEEKDKPIIFKGLEALFSTQEHLKSHSALLTKGHLNVNNTTSPNSCDFRANTLIPGSNLDIK